MRSVAQAISRKDSSRSNSLSSRGNLSRGKNRSGCHRSLNSRGRASNNPGGNSRRCQRNNSPSGNRRGSPSPSGNPSSRSRCRRSRKMRPSPSPFPKHEIPLPSLLKRRAKSRLSPLRRCLSSWCSARAGFSAKSGPAAKPSLFQGQCSAWHIVRYYRYQNDLRRQRR